MKIKLFIFLKSIRNKENGVKKIMMKTFESTFRPVVGDIIDDPGFDPRFHNGYEVVKVTVDYARHECYVSLSPLAIELEEISLYDYINKLTAYGWEIVAKEDL